MRIDRLQISNYKSLRHVEMAPQPLSVIIGANASGKSNFADCLDFIAETYRHGLEAAVERKGGYENIAFRRQKRTRSPIEIQLAIELSEDDFYQFFRVSTKRVLRIEHSFTFGASGSSIRAAFKILREVLIISEQKEDSRAIVASIQRQGDNINIEASEELPVQNNQPQRPRSYEDIIFDFSELKIWTPLGKVYPSTELFVNFLGRIANEVVAAFARTSGNIRVFQISPSKSRESGVPIPQPELDRLGGNLPAVIDTMRKTNPEAWDSVMDTMRGIMPDLHSIEVDYTSSRRLGLFFREAGLGRPWGIEEVSDGTVQTLALLVAIFDPTSTALVLEEPENSVHPWIIRRIMDACRQASAKKQIILTSHSPIVINSVRPEEVWVIWREKGESHLAELSKLDPEVLPLWETGGIPTFEYIDSGALLEAIPPAPSDNGIVEELGLRAK